VLYADTAVTSKLLGRRDLRGVLVTALERIPEGCIACFSCEKTGMLGVTVDESASLSVPIFSNMGKT